MDGVLGIRGTVDWVDGETNRGELVNGSIQGNRLVMMIDYGGPYSVLLHNRGGDYYEGEWFYREGPHEYRGPVSGTLYRAASEHLFFGTWVENGRWLWWVKLTTFEIPDDE